MEGEEDTNDYIAQFEAYEAERKRRLEEEEKARQEHLQKLRESLGQKGSAPKSKFAQPDMEVIKARLAAK